MTRDLITLLLRIFTSSRDRWFLTLLQQGDLSALRAASWSGIGAGTERVPIIAWIYQALLIELCVTRIIDALLSLLLLVVPRLENIQHIVVTLNLILLLRYLVILFLILLHPLLKCSLLSLKVSHLHGEVVNGGTAAAITPSLPLGEVLGEWAFGDDLDRSGVVFFLTLFV